MSRKKGLTSEEEDDFPELAHALFVLAEEHLDDRAGGLCLRERIEAYWKKMTAAQQAKHAASMALTDCPRGNGEE